jgi:16S rRNA (guanine966-N2)-methyltransferase
VLVDRSPQAVALIKKAATGLRRHASWDPATMSIEVLRLSADKAIDRLVAEKEAAIETEAVETQAGGKETAETRASGTQATETQAAEAQAVEKQAVKTEVTDFCPFDVVFLDPPYALESADLAVLIAKMTSHGLVSDDGEIVLERSTRSQPVALPEGWEAGKPKRYGETTVTYVYKA